MEALTKDVFQGLNLLTLIGFVAMGVGLNQSRQGRAKAPIAFALMGVGTALVFAGLYFAHRTS
jgi:ascorbate-specific PTS system EIIC-type component UlaA